MPDFTMASAMPLIMSSLTLQANLFQLFQPIGGVRARLAEGAGLGVTGWGKRWGGKARRKMARISDADFMCDPKLSFVSTGKAGPILQAAGEILWGNSGLLE